MEPFSVKFENIEIKGDVISLGARPQVICLHGAGISSRKIFTKMRESLAQAGVASCAMDFVGYGDTGGRVEDSSLELRTRQAQAVIEHLNMSQPLTIIAGSMAGYNAVRLTKIFPVANLILLGPAVYRPDAYSVAFGDDFAALIRQPESWQNTDAWNILKDHAGNLLILTGEKDDVIPPAVIQKIHDSAEHAASREILTIAGAPHRLASYLQEHSNELSLVVDKIVALIQ